MKNTILNFLSSLEGYHQRLKEIHWSTNCKAEHLLTDDIDGDILEYEDKIAEVIMGLLHTRYGIGDLKTLVPESKSLGSLLKELDKDVDDLKKKASEEKYAGLINALDDFKENINKWMYLETFS